MRVGVLRTQVPFVSGGAERHAANLVSALNAYGHAAEEIALPFKWYPGKTLVDHILSARMLDLTEAEGVPVDMVIGLKFPAYLVPHPNKLFWVIHQHRQAYDMWDLGTSDLLDDPDGAAVRALIQAEDRAAFAQTPHPIYANSGNVASRLKTHLGVDAAPLYHPPPNADRMMQGKYGEYLFAPGRLNASKRIDLILHALASTGSRIPLVVAGVAENPEYQNALITLAHDLGVADRVTWLGPVDDETLLRHYAEARAVVFTPQDEDYGYITLEAMLAAKPVITVTDAGGPLEFITNGAEGCVTAPTATALGSAFQEMMDDPNRAERLGQAGLARYQGMNLSWERVVTTLVGRSEQHAHPTPPRKTVLSSGVAALRAKLRPKPPSPDTAVAKLEQAVAPPPAPSGLPFANVTDVLRAYAFEELPGLLGNATPPIDTGLASYLDTHWTRYMTTLRALEGLELRSALDVGVFPPLVFQALLAQRFPGVSMSGLWEGPDPYHQQVTAHDARHPSFDITLRVANSERDPWPYDDDSFDLVTGMEILEHLALDPFFFFAEAARVLKPGGHILLTTPNVVSHRGVMKMLQGIAPYSFGIFVPSGGVYGRHNREYAPNELPELGQAAGFETRSLRTFDVYDRHVDPVAAELLVARKDILALRGETIFYLAQNTGEVAGVPKRFYHGDPTRMTGRLSVVEADQATGLTRICVKNGSAQWWPISGEYATCILAEWIDATGMLSHQRLLQPITASIAPNSHGMFALRVDPHGTAAQGILRLHLYQAGVGAMTGLGRASALELPCSEEAFLQIVKSTPLPGDTA